MVNKLITALLITVIGLAMLPAITSLADDVSYDVTVPEQSLDFTTGEATETHTLPYTETITTEMLEDITISINGTTVVEDGSAVEDTIASYTVVAEEGTIVTNDGSEIVIATSGEVSVDVWEAEDDLLGSEFTFTVQEETEEKSIAPLISILPFMYVIMLVTSLVVFIRFKQ